MRVSIAPSQIFSCSAPTSPIMCNNLWSPPIHTRPSPPRPVPSNAADLFTGCIGAAVLTHRNGAAADRPSALRNTTSLLVLRPHVGFKVRMPAHHQLELRQRMRWFQTKEWVPLILCMNPSWDLMGFYLNFAPSTASWSASLLVTGANSLSHAILQRLAPAYRNKNQEYR